MLEQIEVRNITKIIIFTQKQSSINTAKHHVTVVTSKVDRNTGADILFVLLWEPFQNRWPYS